MVYGVNDDKDKKIMMQKKYVLTIKNKMMMIKIYGVNDYKENCYEAEKYSVDGEMMKRRMMKKNIWC